MASIKAFDAIMERLIEKTKAANPGTDLHKKPAKKVKIRKAKRMPKIKGFLH